MGKNQRRNRGLETGVFLLVAEMLRLGLDTLPPVTLLTVIGQLLLYTGYLDVPWNKYDVCISGHKVWNRRDWKSMLLSTFEHSDDMHLYYNMISFLVKGRSLEVKYGTVNFALLLAFFCVTTPAIYVGLAVVGSVAMENRDLMKSCAIGFSGVIFALKFITTVDNHGYSYISGFKVPVKYSAWVELVVIHLLVPNASFMGHLAGILSGYLYMKTFVGTIVNAVISSITGQPMVHRPYGFTYDASNSSYQRRENNYTPNFYNNNYFTNYNGGSRRNGGYEDYGYPRDYYHYDSRPSAPPSWQL